MKATVKQLLGIQSVSEQVELSSINFEGKGAKVSFVKNGTTFTIQMDNTDAIFGLFKTKIALKEDKEEFASDDELEIPGSSTTSFSSFVNRASNSSTPKVAKKSRRIKCPLSGELITSEEYQENKKNGLYAKKDE